MYSMLVYMFIYLCMHAFINRLVHPSVCPSAFPSVGPASHSFVYICTVIHTSFMYFPTHFCTHLSNVLFFYFRLSIYLYASIYQRRISEIAFQCSDNFISRPNSQTHVQLNTWKSNWGNEVIRSITYDYENDPEGLWFRMEILNFCYSLWWPPQCSIFPAKALRYTEKKRRRNTATVITNN